MVDWTRAFSFFLLCHIVTGVSKSTKRAETYHTNKTEDTDWPSLDDLYSEVHLIRDAFVVVNCSLLLIDQRIISPRAVCEILETVWSLIRVVLSRLR